VFAITASVKRRGRKSNGKITPMARIIGGREQQRERVCKSDLPKWTFHHLLMEWNGRDSPNIPDTNV
jgi:hypothetical protein